MPSALLLLFPCLLLPAFVRLLTFSGCVNPKHVLLTFDDGPGPDTSALLDTLSEFGVKAAFFVMGIHVQEYPELVRRIVKEGHALGHHSWDHPSGMGWMGEEELRAQLQPTLNIIDEALRDGERIGGDVNLVQPVLFFRPLMDILHPC